MPKDIKKETLAKIEKENIKVRSKNYFWFWKILLYSATSLLILGGIYVFNMMIYLPKRSPVVADERFLAHFLIFFPWPLLFLGSLIVGLLVFLYRNYEGGYKKHLGISAIIVFAFLLLGGAAIAGSRFNERMERRPGLHRFYQWHDDNFSPRGPRDGSRPEMGPGRMNPAR